MNVLTKRVLHFPITKIIIGIVIPFALFVLIQNFVLKPLFYSIVQDKSIVVAIIQFISLIVLLAVYYPLFRLYDKREIKELSLKYIFKEMFGGFFFGFIVISLSIFILYLLRNYQAISFSTTRYSTKFFTILLFAATIEDLFQL